MANSTNLKESIIYFSTNITGNPKNNFNNLNAPMARKVDETERVCEIFSSNNFCIRDDSTAESLVANGVPTSESRMLRQPVHESNDNSDEDSNEVGPQIIPEKLQSECFPKLEIIRNGRTTNAHELPDSDKIKSSSASSYYFIDASTLNDEIDVATTNIVGYPNVLNEQSTWSSLHAPNDHYIPTSNSNRILFTNDSSDKISTNSPREYSNLQQMEYGGCRLESQEAKKLSDSIMQDDALSCASISKESLVVEIKEADSGESAQLSPCLDNTKVNNIHRVQNKLVNTDLGLEKPDYKLPEKEVKTESKNIEDEINDLDENDERKPKFIRRNTFELEANDEKLSSLRQEYERRQGSLVFQNSITQYSQHLINDDSYLDAAIADQTDTTLGPALEFALDKYKLDSSEREEPSETVVVNSSDRLLLENSTLEEAIGFTSLPVGINDDLIDQTKSKLRRNEAAPIISGGASSEDFRTKVDSPCVRRKTESTPILSGGSPASTAIAPVPTQLTRKPKPGSWIVDMSNCGQRPKTTGRPLRDSSDSKHSSLGYFVDLEDVEGPRPPEASRHRRRPSEPGVVEKSYCEFFIDLKAGTVPVSKTPMSSSSQTSEPAAGSKKNIFSMFIDLSEPGAGSGRNPGISKSSSSSKLVDKRSELKDSPTPTSERKPRSGVFMFIESDSPVVRRRTMSSSRGTFKRHSWNTDKSAEEQQQPAVAMVEATIGEPQSQQQTLSFKRIHKRAHSLSVDRSGDLRKFLASRSSGESCHSLNESLDRVSLAQTQEQQTAEEVEASTRFDYEVRDTPPNSHVEILDEELLASLKARHYQELDSINEQANERKDLEEGEEQRSGTARLEDCLSDSSSVWDKNTAVTESTETNRSRKSETFDITSSGTSTSTTSELSSASNNLDSKLNDLLDATQRKLAITKIVGSSELIGKEKPGKMNNKTIPASFVRLSDLDTRPLSNSTNSAPTYRENPAARLSSSVVETSWIESKLIMSGSTRTNDSLRKPFAKTLPISVLTSLSKSENFHDIYGEGEHEGTFSESSISSLQSSMARSGQGSVEETETSTSFALGKPQNRLGEDLLRMFIEEINPDVTIDVGGQRIRAHKCILSSRCQYFAAILSGDWVENTGNIISLQGYSYNAVHFALCHIYSGESCIPDSISIVELATLADMLCLEGLKEVIAFTLKVKYCHLFHKPCSGCLVGVLECMPLAAACGLDEVYRKSLRWITRHFVRIWPTKEFATLPRELMEKCYHQHIAYMSVDNILQSIMDCDKLLTTLPNVRWAESVFRLVSNLLDTSMKYLTDNFANVLGNENFQGLDRESTWNISRLEEHLIAAAGRLSPEQACKSYSKLDKIMACAYTDDIHRAKLKWSPLFLDLINKIRQHVEKCLIRDAARAARTNAWLKMDLELRRRVQELACLVILPNEATTKRMSRHSNFTKALNETEETKMVTSSRNPLSRSSDLRKGKIDMLEYNERMLKQTPLLQTRKLLNKPKTDPLERKLQTDKLSADLNNAFKPKTWSNKIEVKSRYLEPRNRFTAKEASVAQAQQEKLMGQQRKKIMISSSDSSRTSSPAMKRAAEKKALSGRVTKVPIKRDGKALSSDSLTDSTGRFGVKKDTTSRSCGMTRPESPLSRTTTSAESPALTRKNALGPRTGRADTSVSTDSLATAMTSPKALDANKSSPVIGQSAGATGHRPTAIERVAKKASPLMQRGTPSTMRRPARSLESSTAASRSRAAAVAGAYNGTLSLRKSLLDAARAPDVPSASKSSSTSSRSSLRQPSASFTKLSSKARDSVVSNQRNTSVQPRNERSPKLGANTKLSKSNIAVSKQRASRIEDKVSSRGKSQGTTASTGNRDGPKFLNQSSRSGTFLKDEPTILNKSDIQTATIDV